MRSSWWWEWVSNLLLNIHPHLNREAHGVFKAGKSQDGWFSADDLLEQIEKSIDIFKSKTNGFATGLFFFDNAPSHQHHAGDGLSAQKMQKQPKNSWTHQKEGPKMCNGTYGVSNTSWYFYFLDDHPTMLGWFKEWKTLFSSRVCGQKMGSMHSVKVSSVYLAMWSVAVGICYSHSQTSLLKNPSFKNTLCTSCGHICGFYLKFHCELNFLKQYWGVVKFHYHSSPKTLDMDAVVKNVLACLDAVPLLHICWWVLLSNLSTYLELILLQICNWSGWFIPAYVQGLSGAEAV